MCPSALGQAYKATNWYLPTGYPGSTDYYNTCATAIQASVPANFIGVQFPRTGDAYFGFIICGDRQAAWQEYREYLGNGLKQQLKGNSLYCVTYYVSLAETVDTLHQT